MSLRIVQNNSYSFLDISLNTKFVPGYNNAVNKPSPRDCIPSLWESTARDSPKISA